MHLQPNVVGGVGAGMSWEDEEGPVARDAVREEKGAWGP